MSAWRDDAPDRPPQSRLSQSQKTLNRWVVYVACGATGCHVCVWFQSPTTTLENDLTEMDYADAPRDKSDFFIFWWSIFWSRLFSLLFMTFDLVGKLFFCPDNLLNSFIFLSICETKWKIFCLVKNKKDLWKNKTCFCNISVKMGKWARKWKQIFKKCSTEKYKCLHTSSSNLCWPLICLKVYYQINL